MEWISPRRASLTAPCLPPETRLASPSAARRFTSPCTTAELWSQAFRDALPPQRPRHVLAHERRRMIGARMQRRDHRG